MLSRLWKQASGLEPADGAVLSPHGFAAVLPDIDADEDAEAPGLVSGSLAHEPEDDGRTYVLNYVDARGQPSTRRVLLKFVFERGGVTYLQCVCLERGARRSFRRDRITGVFSGVTGEDLGPAETVFSAAFERTAWFEHASAGAGSSTKTVRMALRVLATLARCDGHVHRREVPVIERFLCEALPEAPTEELGRLTDYALGLAPAFDPFVDCIVKVREADPLMADLMRRCAYDLVKADGVVCDEEAAAICWLNDLMGSAYGEGLS